MKSLIVVAGYGIKNHNKRVEVELLNKLQPIRNEYDILYISHTHANELIQDLIDYSEHILFAKITDIPELIKKVISNYEYYYNLLNIDNVNYNLNDHLIKPSLLIK